VEIKVGGGWFECKIISARADGTVLAQLTDGKVHFVEDSKLRKVAASAPVIIPKKPDIVLNSPKLSKGASPGRGLEIIVFSLFIIIIIIIITFSFSDSNRKVPPKVPAAPKSSKPRPPVPAPPAKKAKSSAEQQQAPKTPKTATKVVAPAPKSAPKKVSSHFAGKKRKKSICFFTFFLFVVKKAAESKESKTPPESRSRSNSIGSPNSRRKNQIHNRSSNNAETIVKSLVSDL
jgi:hypothetical protein